MLRQLLLSIHDERCHGCEANGSMEGVGKGKLVVEHGTRGATLPMSIHC